MRGNGRAELEKQGEAAICDRFPTRSVTFAANLALGYVNDAVENIRADLRALRDMLAFHRQERQTPFEIQAGILQAADALQSEAGRAVQNIGELGEHERAALTNPPPIPPQYARAEGVGLLPGSAMMLLPLLGP